MKERKVPLRIALPSDETAAENEDQTGPGIVLLDRNGRIAIQEEAVRTLYGIEDPYIWRSGASAPYKQ